MPERIAKLRTLLEELDQELHSVDSLDDESRRLLQEMAGEIQAALQAESIHDMEHESMSSSLTDSVSEFKSSHPTLYAVVHRMVDVLGQMGI